jgi:hypothetical protein
VSRAVTTAVLMVAWREMTMAALTAVMMAVVTAGHWDCRRAALSGWRTADRMDDLRD